jgi:hypothetical protein
VRWSARVEQALSRRPVKADFVQFEGNSVQGALR